MIHGCSVPIYWNFWRGCLGLQRVTISTPRYVGVSSVKASGEVYKLTDPADFAGTYFAGQAGGALVGGGSSVVMKNKKGVVMRLQSIQKGLRLTLAPEGISIESVE